MIFLTFADVKQTNFKDAVCQIKHNIAIHDIVYEMARDEARHGKAFAGLLKRYFG
ncbi:MAG: hypothetical protein K2I10_01290 [Lachnospiraceae bacterium]|nr:hypothetical protein [Lachnospiraceae bacterium]